MSKQSLAMPSIDQNTFTRLSCAVFCTSSLTAFVLAVLRLLKPEVFYENELIGKNLIIHLVICGMMVVTSTIGFINSCVVMARSSSENTLKFITTWLLLDSLFETSRVVYMFMCEVVLPGDALMQTYDLCISCGQYFLDSLFYCQMVLRQKTSAASPRPDLTLP